MMLFFGLWVIGLNAQTLVDETFDTEIPAEWTKLNVNTDSYEFKSPAQYAIGGTKAYAAAMGCTDDYLITPQLNITSADFVLDYSVGLESASFMYSFKVMVSTTDTDPTSFTEIYNEVDFATVGWTAKQIDLDAYNGQSIYVAFYVYAAGSTSYSFGFDNIKISAPIANDLSAESLTISPSSVFDGDEVTFTANVINEGSDAQTDVVVDFTVDGLSIGTQTIASIASGATESVSVTWTAAQGSYEVGFSLPADDFAENNEYSTTLPVYSASALVEDFEGTWLPDGWSLAPLTSTWYQGTFGAYEGAKCAYISTSGEKRLITPMLDLSSPTAISFYGKTGFGAYTLKLQYSSDKSTWTDVPSGSFSLSATYELKNIDLSGVPAGNYYLAFVYNLSYTSVYIDNVMGPEIVAEAPMAAINPTPADAAASVAEDIALSWSANGTGGIPTGYKVYFGTDGAGTATPTNIVNGTEQSETSYTPASVLDFETTYYWQIVPTNAEGDAASCPIWSFTTKQDPTRPIPFFEDFETTAAFAVPTDWSNFNYSVNETHGVGGSHCLAINMHSGTTSASVTTPAVGMLSAVANQVKFDYRLCDYTAYPTTATTLTTDKIEVQLSTNGGVDFTTIHTINQSNHVVSNEYATVTLNLDAAYNDETVKLRFLNTWGSGDYFVDIDNVEIREPSLTPVFHISTDALDFAALPTNFEKVKSIIISNDGGGTLEIADGGIVFSGADAADFSVENVVYPIELGAGESLTVEVVCNATTAGTKVASMDITHNAAKGSVQVTLAADVYAPYLTYMQNFDAVPEDEIPAQWNKIETGMGMVYVVADAFSTYSHSAPNTLIIANYSQQSGDLLAVMPAVDFDNTRLMFWAKADYNAQPLSIGTMSNPNDASTYTEFEVVTINNTYAQYEIDMSAYAGSDMFIAMKHGMGTTNNAFYIDDVLWETIPTTPVCSVSPSTLVWDLASVGMMYSQTLTVTNVGINTLIIEEADLTLSETNAAEFSVTDVEFPIELGEQESAEIVVNFAPAQAGLREAVLTVAHNGGNASVDVALSGNGFDGLVEDFNNAGSVFPPVGWTAAPAWKSQTFATYEGAGAAWFNPYSEVVGEKLITPLLNYVSGDVFSFYAKKVSNEATITLQYTTDTTTGIWENIDVITVANAEYTLYEVDLSALPEGELFIALSGSGLAFTSMYLDYVIAPRLATQFAVDFTVTSNVSGEAIEGATVTINGTQAATDATGFVSFNLNNGTYDYLIEANGFADVAGSVTVDNDVVSEAVEMTSVDMHMVTFTVTNENSDPIVGAAISIDNQDLITDGAGVASLYLADDTYTYSVTAAGYAPVEDVTLEVAGADVAEEVTLLDVYELSFHVTDDNNTPIEGAFVIVGGTFLATDANGDASIDAVNGTYVYAVTKADYETVDGEVTVAGADAHADVVIRLVYFVDFTINDISGNPIEDVEILFSDSTLVTDIDGEAFIEIANGTYEVVVSKTGYLSSTFDVVVDGSHQELTVTLYSESDMHTVTFVVTDESGAALADAQIDMEGNDMQTDDLGHASIMMPDGSYNFTITLAGYEPYSSTALVNGEDLTVNVSMLGQNHLDIVSRIYPNPATDVLFIESANECALTIFNAAGQVVHTSEFVSSTTVNVADLESGLYVVRIISANQSVTSRVVLK